MKMSLPVELEALISRKIDAGLYKSTDEVVCAALRLLEQRDQLRQLQLDELRRDIAVGIGQAQRGEVEPLDVKSIQAEAKRRAEDQSKRAG